MMDSSRIKKLLAALGGGVTGGAAGYGLGAGLASGINTPSAPKLPESPATHDVPFNEGEWRAVRPWQYEKYQTGIKEYKRTHRQWLSALERALSGRAALKTMGTGLGAYAGAVLALAILKAQRESSAGNV